MRKYLTAHGSSAALIIDKAILELLNIEIDTPLEIVTDGENLIISPVRDLTQNDRATRALERVNVRQSDTLVGQQDAGYDALQTNQCQKCGRPYTQVLIPLRSGPQAYHTPCEREHVKNKYLEKDWKLGSVTEAAAGHFRPCRFCVG